ncbi:MAG TPA: LLM class flavin-dependent oxidoreductase [Ktedonobacterales bacterium]|jgi:alkanesulfonate monooxygenase SsuD/methylene tetrahydromethanopterin reductase-like flavin-dependent oxidoreductase (luciferase family)
MGDLRFGWHMPSCPVDGSSAADFLDQLRQALAHLQPHFDSVWVDDHVVAGSSWLPNETPYLECLTTIAYLAPLYPTLQFGSGVLCQSYRNPALMAKMTANLQWLTGGRFLFGIGAGWMQEEYQAYHFDFPTPSVRVDQLEEAIQIVKRLWTQSPASFAGKYYQIENAYCAPPPDPMPPILIGGGGERKTLRVVARYADWWNLPGGTLENYAHKLDVLRQHCQEVGRDFDDIVKTWSPEAIAIAATEGSAQQIAATSPYKKDVIVGTPRQVAAQLKPFVDLGVERLIIRIIDFPAMTGVDLFVQEVMPLLRQ